MHARVLSARMAPEQLESLTRLMEEQVLPEVRVQPGFEGALGLVDPSTGQGMVITFWATPEDLAAGEASGFVGRQIATVAPYLREPVRRETLLVTADIRRSAP